MNGMLKKKSYGLLGSRAASVIGQDVNFSRESYEINNLSREVGVPTSSDDCHEKQSRDCDLHLSRMERCINHSAR